MSLGASHSGAILLLTVRCDGATWFSQKARRGMGWRGLWDVDVYGSRGFSAATKEPLQHPRPVPQMCQVVGARASAPYLAAMDLWAAPRPITSDAG